MEGAIHESCARTHARRRVSKEIRSIAWRSSTGSCQAERGEAGLRISKRVRRRSCRILVNFLLLFFFLSFCFFLFQPAPCSAAYAFLRMRGCTRTSRRNPDTFEKPYNNPTFLTRGTTRPDKKSPFRARPCPINIKEETLFLARIKVFKDAEITALTFAT